MKKINTPKAPAPIGPYSQAIYAGGLLFVSGQIPVNPATGKSVTGDIALETKRVMDNVKAILEEAGMNFGNVVKSSVFITDLNNFSRVNEVYGSYFTGGHPARETVEVARLPGDAHVEISVIASH